MARQLNSQTAALSVIFKFLVKLFRKAQASPASSKLWRWIHRGCIAFGIGLFLLIGLVACLLFFPPNGLIRSALVSIARTTLQNPSFNIRHLDLDLLHGLAIEGIFIGPPPGFSQPLLEIERIILRYDLRRIAEGQFTLHELTISHPRIAAEFVENKLNWHAFAESLSPSTTPPSKSEEEAKPASSPTIDVNIEKVAIESLSASYSKGDTTAQLNDLSLLIQGNVSPKQTRATITLSLGSGSSSSNSFGSAQNESSTINVQIPIPKIGASAKEAFASQDNLTADLATRVSLRTNIASINPPQGTVTLKAAIETVSFKAPWTVPPTKLQFDLDASSTNFQEGIQVQRAEVRLNDALLLALHAQVNDLSRDPNIALTISSLTLAAETLMPYLRGFLPDLMWRGTVALQNVSVEATRSQLMNKMPRVVSGELFVRDLDLALPPRLDPQQSRIEKLQGEIKLNLAESTNATSINSTSIRNGSLKTQIAFDTIETNMISLQRGTLDLDATIDIHGKTPSSVKTHAQLRFPKVTVRAGLPAPWNTSLALNLTSTIDLLRKRVEVEQLMLDWHRRMRLDLKGTAQDDRDRFLVDMALKIPSFDLARVIHALPYSIQRQIPYRATGKIGISTTISGTIPSAGFKATDLTFLTHLPLRLRAEVALNNVALDDPLKTLQVENLSGPIVLHAIAPTLEISTDLHFDHVALNRRTLSLENLTFPLRMTVRANALSAQVHTKIQRLEQNDPPIRLDDVAVDTALSSGLRFKGKFLSLEESSFSLSVKVSNLLGEIAAAAISARHAAFHTSFKLPSTTIDLSTSTPKITPQATAVSIEGSLSELSFKQPGRRMNLANITTELMLNASRERGVTVSLRSSLGTLVAPEDGISMNGATLSWSGTLPVMAISFPFAMPLLHRLEATSTLLATIDRVDATTMLDKPLTQNRFALDVALHRGGRVTLRDLRLSVPGKGIRISGSATLDDNLFALTGPFHSLPAFRMNLNVALDLPRQKRSQQATLLVRDLKAAGKAALSLAVSGKQDRLDLRGRMIADAFSLWTRIVAEKATPARPTIKTVSTVHLKSLNADIPFSQSMFVDLKEGTIRLPKPAASLFQEQQTSSLYRELRRYSDQRNNVYLSSFELDESVSAIAANKKELGSTRRKIVIDKASLDLRYEDGTFLMKRFYAKLFDGDLDGSFRVQLDGFDSRRNELPDLRLAFEAQATGINLDYLDAQKQAKPNPKSAISALLNLSYWKSRELISGRIDITQISLSMLDSLFGYLDPNGIDANVQRNRKLLGYASYVRPQIKLVSAWIDHSNLNMDIDMDAIEPLGAILRSALKNSRIRRLNLLPLIGSN